MADRIPFHNRGEHMSRIDGFSDVVFGFALTLLVVSLEVPHTFNELLESLRGFLPFSICFFFLIQIWYVHYRFFRRYGLEDNRVILLNSLLLFVVLLFVYPLKFLFTLITLHPSGAGMTTHNARALLTIYGLGYAAVWGIFALMHLHAYSKRQLLDLNEIELIDTRETIATCAGQVAVGLLSVVITFLLPDRLAGMSGFTYMLIGVTNTWMGTHYGRQRRSAETRLLGAHSAAVHV